MSPGVMLLITAVIACEVVAIRDGDRAVSTALRLKGLQLGYDLDRDEASSAFTDAVAADPTDSAAYRLAAATVWIDLLFRQGAVTVDDYLGQVRPDVPRGAPPADLDAAFRRSIRQALTLAEDRLRANPLDADAHYEVGAAYGVLASYAATVEGRVLGSLGHARRAYQEHERTLELDATRKDACLIVGLYRYSVAGFSLPMRLLARLAGFDGDRERGLRMVEEAARFESDAQPSALFTLILIYNREHRYDDALATIRDLQRRFPRNRLLWLEAGSTALRAGRFAEARDALEEGLSKFARDERRRAPGEESRWQSAYSAALAALKKNPVRSRGST